MHDLDRASLEFDPEVDATELDESETDALEFGLSDEGELPVSDETDSPLSEQEEIALASEFLGLTNEAEVDYFLGKLIKKVGGSLGKVAKSPVGKMVGGYLKPLLKKALPIAGTALGTMFGGPLGAKLGGQLGSMAGGMFEVEGLSAEDQSFEVARKVVRMAGSAAANALSSPPGVPPVSAAKTAVLSAARRHTPGLVGAVTPHGLSGSIRSHSGRWYRRGNRIIVVDVF